MMEAKMIDSGAIGTTIRIQRGNDSVKISLWLSKVSPPSVLKDGGQGQLFAQSERYLLLHLYMTALFA